MPFSVMTKVSEVESFKQFIEEWKIQKGDLIITNSYLIPKGFDESVLTCDVLYQEAYGKGEPSDVMVDAMINQIKGKHYDRIVAIGGGTIIDIAKLFVFGGDLLCESIFTEGPKLKKMRKLIIVPTTCGTGSEVTNISIVEFKSKKTKLGLATEALFADEAVLIPELLNTIPYEIFASSSIDALIHAVESFVSPRATAFTKIFSQKAIEDILTGYENHLNSSSCRGIPKDLSTFLKASTMAGIAFGNAGVGAVHALSYPLSGLYHVPHGEANYMMFEAVIRAYKQLGADLSEVEAVVKKTLNCDDASIWTKFFNLLDGILDKKAIREYGADEQICRDMTVSSIANQQRLLVNTPLKLSEEAIYNIYLKCL